MSYHPVRAARGQVSANRQWVSDGMAMRILGKVMISCSAKHLGT